MMGRRLKLLLALLLLLPPVGCGAARRLYFSVTHQVVRVPTGNMEPNIRPGDFAAVNPRAYAERGPERFDMVMFERAPQNAATYGLPLPESTLYIKRVIGLGGETLEIRGGRVYVDGRVLAEPYATVPLDPQEEFAVRIPVGEYFLLGDNRPNSEDGRFWAKPTVTRDQIKGKVVEIFRG